DVYSIFKYLSRSEYGFVERIIPVFKVVNTNYDEILEGIRDLISRFNVKEICLRIRIRGVRGLSMRLWAGIKEVLLKNNVRLDKRSNYCIYVESVGEITGISIIPKDMDKVHRRKSL
ncbi:MAG: hypothetical protein J7K21_05645, partial [Desulfurococcales archaeon]|nr:hypothetical protein [Desulfurococcales archaeon]